MRDFIEILQKLKEIDFERNFMYFSNLNAQFIHLELSTHQTLTVCIALLRKFAYLNYYTKRNIF